MFAREAFTRPSSYEYPLTPRTQKVTSVPELPGLTGRIPVTARG